MQAFSKCLWISKCGEQDGLGVEREAKDRKEVEGKNGGIGRDAEILTGMANDPEMKCSVDEWLKTEGFEECMGGCGCEGWVYPEGLGLLPTQAPADSLSLG